MPVYLSCEPKGRPAPAKVYFRVNDSRATLSKVVAAVRARVPEYRRLALLAGAPPEGAASLVIPDAELL